MYEINSNAIHLVVTFNYLILSCFNVTLNMGFSEDKLALYESFAINMVVVLILSHVRKKAKICC